MSATVLRFPERDKGRKRKRRSVNTMGRVILSLIERDGEEIPANVVCIDQPEGRDEECMPRDEFTLLAICVYAMLSKEQKRSIRNQLRMLATANGEKIAQRVLNTLELGTKF